MTHSIPTAMNATSGPDGNGYVAWHLDVAAEIDAELERRTGQSAADRPGLLLAVRPAAGAVA